MSGARWMAGAGARLEWWLAKKANLPIRIEEKPLAIPQAGSPISVPVENLNFWKDLNDYVCQWQLGAQKGRLHPRVAPQTKGVVTIPVKHPPQTADTLVLEFRDETGRMIDGYKLKFQPRETPAPPKSGKPARILECPWALTCNRPMPFACSARTPNSPTTGAPAA